MNQILQTISDAIINRLPNEFKKSVFLARIDDEGRVLIPSGSQNEFVFAGLDDREGGFFYIRHREGGKIQFSESPTTKKFAAMQNFTRVRYELRLVACVRNVEPYFIEEQIRFAIMNANLPSCAAFANVAVEPVESNVDSIAVLKEESPKKSKPFDKNLFFISHDFNIVGDRDFALEYYCENPCQNSSC